MNRVVAVMTMSIALPYVLTKVLGIVRSATVLFVFVRLRRLADGGHAAQTIRK